MELKIGSNIYRNTNGILKIHGKEQAVFEVRADPPELALTMDLYDVNGSHIAHLRRNSWALNPQNRFECHTKMASSLSAYLAWLNVLDTETGDILLEAQLVKEDTVLITQGKLLTHKGQPLEITPHCWRLPGQPSMFGNVQDNRGCAVIID